MSRVASVLRLHMWQARCQQRGCVHCRVCGAGRWGDQLGRAGGAGSRGGQDFLVGMWRLSPG